MIRLAALLLLLASTCWPPASTCAAHGIAPVPSTHKLTATSPGVLTNFPVRPANLRAARGEWECFQIVVRADKRGIKNLKLRATMLATHLGRFLGLENVQVFREHFTHVPKPSGNRELRPLWWSDALIPTAPTDTIACEPNKAIAFWVAVRAPIDAEPDEYYGAIDFEIDGQERVLVVPHGLLRSRSRPPSVQVHSHATQGKPLWPAGSLRAPPGPLADRPVGQNQTTAAMSPATGSHTPAKRTSTPIASEP